MRAAITIVAALSLLAAASAFPSLTYYTAVAYNNVYCNGTVVAGTSDPVPIDTCVASSSTSNKFVIANGVMTRSNYNTADCSGTASSTSTFTNGQCVASGLAQSSKYVFPAALAGVPLYSQGIYSDADCTVLTSGPNYHLGLGQTCSGGNLLTMKDGPLVSCQTNCDSDCVKVPLNACTAAGSSYINFDSNGVGAQAVVTYATAALVAVAAVVLSL